MNLLFMIIAFCYTSGVVSALKKSAIAFRSSTIFDNSKIRRSLKYMKYAREKSNLARNIQKLADQIPRADLKVRRVIHVNYKDGTDGEYHSIPPLIVSFYTWDERYCELWPVVVQPELAKFQKPAAHHKCIPTDKMHQYFATRFHLRKPVLEISVLSTDRMRTTREIELFEAWLKVSDNIKITKELSQLVRSLLIHNYFMWHSGEFSPEDVLRPHPSDPERDRATIKEDLARMKRILELRKASSMTKLIRSITQDQEEVEVKCVLGFFDKGTKTVALLTTKEKNSEHHNFCEVSWPHQGNTLDYMPQKDAEFTCFGEPIPEVYKKYGPDRWSRDDPTCPTWGMFRGYINDIRVFEAWDKLAPTIKPSPAKSNMEKLLKEHMAVKPLEDWIGDRLPLISKSHN